MTTFVLIIIGIGHVEGSASGYSINPTVAEFKSLYACQAAAGAIRKNLNKDRVLLVCASKGD